LDEATNQLKLLQAKLKDLTSTMSNEQFQLEIDALKAQNQKAEQTL
jgi:hypothetical protein